MPLSKPHKRRRLHVALLVETSLGSGRDILRGIARYVRVHEPWLLYHEPRSLEESAPKWLRHWQGDGIIARIQTPALAEEVLASGIPAVDVLGVVHDTRLPLVHVDDATISRLAATHLLERGFKRFGFFGIDGENWSEHRHKTFAEVVQTAGCELHSYTLPRALSTGHSWEEVQDELARWVADLPKPAGVMVCSDQRGPQLLDACRRAGVRVPDEVAVIGVDNDEPLCEVCNPPLSSVNPNHQQVGYAAAALLSRLMKGKTPPSKPTLIQSMDVVTRLSTDVLAIEDRKLAEALRLIREFACAGLKVDDLARHVGLSRSVLQRRFRTVLRKSVHEEILEVRLKRACDLITSSDLPLIEIAESTGFKHQEYLGAVLKSRLQKTPAQLRRQTSIH